MGPLIIIPSVTPLLRNLSLDEIAVEKIFHFFYQNNASPFILGTTGEAASLPMQLKKDFVNKASKIKKQNTFLYVGISSNVVKESIDFANFCTAYKVDAVVATLPNYYELTEIQMEKYFLTLADAISLPIIIYNIPATTYMSIPLHIIEKLSYHKNIIGIKDSERSNERMLQSIQLWKDRNDFNYYIGWAAKSTDALLTGANGLVPSTGNINPEIYDEMIKALKNNDKEKMYALQQLSDEYGALYQANKTLGESLAALKLIMKEKDLCEEFVMPPL